MSYFITNSFSMKLSRSLLLIFGLFSLVGTFAFYFLFGAYTNGHLSQETADYVPKSSTAEDTDIRKALRIVEWRQDLEVIDNRRIFMHKTSENFHLSARQSCSVESAAKNNPHRPIQVYMQRPKSADSQQQLLDATKTNSPSSSSSWINVLKHYDNIEIVLINEREYFNKSILANWYSTGKWRKSPRRAAHLSDYIRTVTLFKGGGLFLDMDSVVTIKPFAGHKMQNFFMKRNSSHEGPNNYRTVTTGEMMHLLHGHHLIDEIIINMAEYDYDPQDAAHEPFSNAVDASVRHICGGLNDDENRCLDVHLLEDDDIFLPRFDSLFWRSILQLSESGRNNNNKQVIGILEAIGTSGSSLLSWDWLTPALNHLYDRSSYETVLSILLAQHCPLTVAQVSEFPMPSIESN